MHPRLSRPVGDVCWSCRLRLRAQPPPLRQIAHPSKSLSRLSRRSFHAATLLSQAQPTALPAHAAVDSTLPIREQLRQWQELYGSPNEDILQFAFQNPSARPDDIQNEITKLSNNGRSGQDIDEYDLDDDADELMTVSLFLKPGDVVEYQTPGREPMLAVYVQEIDGVCQFILASGKWAHRSLSGIEFVLPGCIDPALLQPLVPYLPTDAVKAVKEDLQVPRQLSAPVLAILSGLYQNAEKIYRQNASVLDTAYSVLADPSRTRMMTLVQIAKTLLARGDPSWRPSTAALLAVRKALHHNDFRFRSNSMQRMSSVYAIRPKDDVEVVEKVHGWIREYNEYRALAANQGSDEQVMPTKGATLIIKFIEKARRLIADSRVYRQPTRGGIGPSEISTPQISPLIRSEKCASWSNPERDIIDFLKGWVLSRQYRTMASLNAACASIIHATGSYEEITIGPVSNTISKETGYTFLQEIGAISPFTNRALHDEDLMLPTTRLSRNVELLNRKVALTRSNPDFRDSMAEFRRDWGSTTIYCIDDAGAKEIDDGLSIQKVAGTDSEFWVHVHVANPTAFFDKTHVLSGLAAHMTETLYTPEQVYRMLPEWASEEYFSLAPKRPTITFSSRVNLAGSILEFKIQHGIIRNVVSLTNSELSEILGEKVDRTLTEMVVGGKLAIEETPRKPPQLSPGQVQELRDMLLVAKSLEEARSKNGYIRGGYDYLETAVYGDYNESGLSSAPELKRSQGRFFHGDPIIKITGRPPYQEGAAPFSASHLVSEMMILACHSAASWCAERGLPVVFRGTVETPTKTIQEPEKFLNEIVKPYKDTNGALSPELATKYLEVMGRAITHTSPIPHKFLGVSSYVKVTSPLRRFSDMICHWQIEAAMRYEARTHKKLTSEIIATTGTQILPFSQNQMHDSIVTLSPREKLIRTAMRSTDRFWQTQAFLRAFYFKQAYLPDTFRIWIKKVLSVNRIDKHVRSIGVMDHMPINVDVLEVPDMEMNVGELWEVKIETVNPYARAIQVKPLHLLKRAEYTDLV